YAQGGAAGLVLAFYAATVTLFPFGVSPEPATLRLIAPGVLWIAALLAALLSLDRVFQADYEDGTLDILALGGLPLALVALAKALAHWLSTLLPLVLLAPLFGIMLQMEPAPLRVLVVALALGTPGLSLVGAIAGALTVAVRRGGALLALLVLPLYVPPLIFGVAAVMAVDGFGSVSANLSLLAGLSLLALVLAPLAAAAALRLALE
ncbi:MAG: heme exporter protein CcmB, partial [Alphaproteobacteria bacterium]